MNALPDEFLNQSDGTKPNKNKIMMSEISQGWGWGFFWGVGGEGSVQAACLLLTSPSLFLRNLSLQSAETVTLITVTVTTVTGLGNDWRNYIIY